MTLTTHTITLPTSEQRAVYAACEERYPKIIKSEWPATGTVLELWVEDTDGRPTQLFVTPEGITRAHYFNGIPTRLYGSVPKREDARRKWGQGLPKYAVKHMPTPCDDSGDEAMCECGAGEHESCRCKIDGDIGGTGDPTMTEA
jgi:hypothetical protein